MVHDDEVGPADFREEEIRQLLRTLPRSKAPPQLYDNLMLRIAEEREMEAVRRLAAADPRASWIGTSRFGTSWAAAVAGAAWAAAGGLFALTGKGALAGMAGRLAGAVEAAAAVYGEVVAAGLGRVAAAVPPGLSSVAVGVGWAVVGWAAAAVVLAVVESASSATTPN